MPIVDPLGAAYAAAAYGRRQLAEGRLGLDREHIDRLVRAAYGGSDKAIVELLNMQRREAEAEERRRYGR